MLMYRCVAVAEVTSTLQKRWKTPNEYGLNDEHKRAQEGAELLRFSPWPLMSDLQKIELLICIVLFPNTKSTDIILFTFWLKRNDIKLIFLDDFYPNLCFPSFFIYCLFVL